MGRENKEGRQEQKTENDKDKNRRELRKRRKQNLREVAGWLNDAVYVELAESPRDLAFFAAK